MEVDNLAQSAQQVISQSFSTDKTSSDLIHSATDILSRYKRMRGFNVLHPMGWDAFGLPAEQYAIETGTHPRETTERNVQRNCSRPRRR